MEKLRNEKANTSESTGAGVPLWMRINSTSDIRECSARRRCRGRAAGRGVGRWLGSSANRATERRSDRDECGRVRLNGNSNCGAAKEESECTAALVEARLSSWREHENGDISDPHLDPQKRERRWPGSKREQPSDERGLALAELLVSAIGRGWMSGAQHPIWVMKFECPKDVVIDLLLLLPPPPPISMDPHRNWAVSDAPPHSSSTAYNNDLASYNSRHRAQVHPSSNNMHAVHHSPYPLPSILQHPHHHQSHHQPYPYPPPSRRAVDTRQSSSPLPAQHGLSHHGSATPHPDVYYAPNAAMLYDHANVIAAAAAAAAADDGASNAHTGTPSAELRFESSPKASDVDYPSQAATPPRLPPILQVEKQQVTTSATQAASASRRRNEAHFVCPVPGCGSTFTRRFNLRGESCSVASRASIKLIRFVSLFVIGHLRSHTEERPYVCEWPGCNKGFARQHDCKYVSKATDPFVRLTMSPQASPSFALGQGFNKHLPRLREVL